MQIACPNCATSYAIEASSIGQGGRMVRCARCKELWFVEAPLPEPVAAAGVAESAFEQQHAEPDVDWNVGGQPLREADYVAGAAEAQPGESEFASPDDAPRLEDAPSLAPDIALADADHAAEPGDEPAGSEEPDYFEVRRRRADRQKSRKKSAGPLVTAQRLIAVLAAVVAAFIIERDNIVRAMPQMASLYSRAGMPVNLRGLAFEDVRTITESQDGVPVLVIEGAIRNVTRGQLEVPRLRFAMRNAAGTEIYSWTGVPDRAVLPAGDVQTFRTRLASPPADSREAYVRFIQRRDLTPSNKTSDRKM